MKTNLLFFICILFVLVSCEQEDKVSGEKALAVVSASSDDRPSTRGIINDDTYALGVFRTTAGTYTPLFNVKHIYSGYIIVMLLFLPIILIIQRPEIMPGWQVALP